MALRLGSAGMGRSAKGFGASLPIAGMSPGFSSRISVSSCLGSRISGETSRDRVWICDTACLANRTGVGNEENKTALESGDSGVE